MAFFWHIIIIGSITLLPVLGFNVVFGRGKILYFGQEVFSLAAAYAVWVLVARFEWPLLAAIAVAAALVIVLSLFFAELSLRLEPDGLGVLTIAMHLMALTIVLNWQSVTRGALGISKIPRLWFPASPAVFAAMAILIAVVWVFLLWRIDRGKVGRALAALAEHPWHASALGINRRTLHTFAFLLAAIGSLGSGILFPAYILFLTHVNYDFPVLIFFITCIVAGGPGRIFGVTAATLALVFLREGLRFFALPYDLIGPVRLILFGLILFIAVWYRRDNLFPTRREI